MLWAVQQQVGEGLTRGTVPRQQHQREGTMATLGDGELTDESEKEQGGSANELQAGECSSVFGGGGCKASPGW